MDFSWNLSQIFADEKDYEKAFDNLKKQVNQIFEFKGKLGTAKDVLLYFKTNEQININADKLSAYLYLRKSLNGKDVWATEKMAELDLFASELETKTVGLSQELKKNSVEKLNEWKKLPEFADYDLAIENIIKAKKHMIPATQEKLIIKSSNAVATAELFDVLNNVELKFGKIRDENGKLVELTQGNYSKYARSQNRNVRKQVAANNHKAYSALNQTIATNYISHIKYVDFLAKTYKYKNTLASKLDAGELPNGLPQKVVKYVCDYLPLLDRYYAWRKRYLGYEKMYGYDLSFPLAGKNNEHYSLDDATKIIKTALLPLGEDYVNHLGTAIAQNWFDTRILPAKESGGYCMDVYSVHPFILTSYNGTVDCVSTLAHEFGHAMHYYYTNKTQPIAKAGIGIFLAEIASTVNEVLLAKYMIDHAKTKEEKIASITNFLTTFIGTIFTQTRYTEFELFVHQKVDKGEPLTYKMMNDFYAGIINKYNGSNVEKTKSGISWSMIPHFYSDFYVFKYVTGFVSACAIAEKLLTEKDYAKKYRKFLSSGSCKKPCEILMDAEVDILDKKTFDNAFKLFEKYLAELEGEEK